MATEVLAALERYGASFLSDIARSLGKLPSEVEEGLWELVAHGIVTGDGIAGLRTLLLPEDKRRGRGRRRAAARHLRPVAGLRGHRLMPIGRWSLLRTGTLAAAADAADDTDAADGYARRLLLRYGVVFRDLMARERRAPSWRELLWALRRMEARGEVRGGRFVAGFAGEQFALPEAVEALRGVRRTQGAGEIALVAAGDPLNLVGILTPGARVSPFSTLVIAYRDGVPVEVGELGEVRSRLQLPRGEAR